MDPWSVEYSPSIPTYNCVHWLCRIHHLLFFFFFWSFIHTFYRNVFTPEHFILLFWIFWPAHVVSIFYISTSLLSLQISKLTDKYKHSNLSTALSAPCWGWRALWVQGGHCAVTPCLPEPSYSHGLNFAGSSSATWKGCQARFKSQKITRFKHEFSLLGRNLFIFNQTVQLEPYYKCTS